MTINKSKSEDFFLEIINTSLKLNLDKNDLPFPLRISQKVLFPFLSDESLIYEISQRSYKHINGFYRLVLFESQNKAIQIRLHVWDENFEQKNINGSDIHGHRWAFISLPLVGEFYEKRFLENQKKEVIYEKYHCHTRSLNQSAYVEKVGMSSLTINTSKIIKIGELNICGRNEIHQFDPIKLPAITLLITYDPNNDFAPAYKTNSHFLTQNDIILPNLSKSEIKKIISYSIEKIAN